jgi:hypothetical protein
VAPCGVAKVVDVVGHRRGQLEGGRPFTCVEQLDLQPGPKRLHRGVIEAIADGAKGGQQGRCGGIVSVVGHLAVPAQEGYLDPQHVLVVKPAGVDVVVSAAAAV